MKATGGIKHHFWGEYYCTLALRFETADGVDRCLGKLGPKWTQVPEQPHLAGAFLNSAELEEFEEKARTEFGLTIAPCGRRDCRHQCRDADLGSVNHSIDYGPTFQVEIPMGEDKSQQTFHFAI